MRMLFIRRWGIVIGCGILCWALAACGAAVPKTRNEVPMTLDALYTFCGIPLNCDSPVAWEDQKVSVTGYADSNSIVHKGRNPRLPYEKFRLVDRKGKSIEVWIKSPNSQSIFSKVYQKLNSQIIVNGRLAVVKMPKMGGCRLSAKVWINDPSQIQ